MDDDRRCTAKNRRGERCKRAAIPGGTVCAMHGGKAPQVKAAAKEREQQAAALDAVRRFALVAEDAVEEIDPRDALARELVRCQLAVEFLGQMVNDLDSVYGDTYHADGGITGRALPHVVWVMWGQERDRLRQVAAEAAKAGVEAHRMRLSEEMARLMAGLMTAIAADEELGLSEKLRQVFLVVAARHMRQLGEA